MRLGRRCATFWGNRGFFAALLVAGAVLAWGAAAWCADAPEGFSEQRVPSSPEKTLVQWSSGGKGVLRALVEAPATPRAGLVLFVGDDGCLGITERGEISRLQENFLVRSVNLFVRQGVVTLLLDMPGGMASESYRTSEDQARNAALAVAYIRSKWHVPVVLMGTSRGSISAADAAARLERGNADALVLSSTVTQKSKKHQGTVYDVKLARIAMPVLLLHNTQDACKVSPYSGVQALAKTFKASPRVDVRALTQADGGTDACRGMSAHGFLGVEQQAVADVCAWIGANVPPQR
jgi:hypothetical protein